MVSQTSSCDTVIQVSNFLGEGEGAAPKVDAVAVEANEGFDAPVSALAARPKRENAGKGGAMEQLAKAGIAVSKDTPRRKRSLGEGIDPSRFVSDFICCPSF